MRTLIQLGLLVVGLSSWASPGQPYFVRQQTSSSVTPASIPGLWYWWVASDLTNTAANVTNWTDRIQGQVFTSAGAAYPTLTGATGAKGVHFTPTSYMTTTPVVLYQPDGTTNSPMLMMIWDSQPTDCYVLGATNSVIKNYINNNSVSTGVQRFSWYTTSVFLFRTNTIFDVYQAFGGGGSNPCEWTNGIAAGTISVNFANNAWKTMNGSGASLGTGTGTFTIYEIAIWTNYIGIQVWTNFIPDLHKNNTNIYKFTP